MDDQQKLAALAGLDERALIDKVIFPLIVNLGFEDPRITHGANEQGADLVFWERDKFGQDTCWSAVVKAGDITGQAKDSYSSITAVIAQVSAALGGTVPYRGGANGVPVDRCAVIASGCIRKAAREVAAARLPHEGLHRVTVFVDGRKILSLCQGHGMRLQVLGEQAEQESRAVAQTMRKLAPYFDPKIAASGLDLDKLADTVEASGIVALDTTLSTAVSTISTFSGLSADKVAGELVDQSTPGTLERRWLEKFWSEILRHLV
jgi:hypothetical protein